MNEHDLAAIEQRAADAHVDHDFGVIGALDVAHEDVPALIAAVRAAWRERDEWKARFIDEAGRWGVSYGELVRDAAALEAERDGYRTLLTRARHGIDSWSTVDLDRLIVEIDAALAAPSAGGA